MQVFKGKWRKNYPKFIIRYICLINPLILMYCRTYQAVKVSSKIVADKSIFYHYFSENMSPDTSCELSARQMIHIHIKCQALFSQKITNKVNVLKFCTAKFLAI